jgi:putative transposase
LAGAKKQGVFWRYTEQMLCENTPKRVSPLPGNPSSHPHGFASGSVGSIVASFKSSVTRRAGRELNSASIWQRNFYEHILRDDPDFKRIATYILSNPSTWDQDEENINFLK